MAPWCCFLVLFEEVFVGVVCPLCNRGRKRYFERGWFMRHMELGHRMTRIAALNCWFDVCSNSKEIPHVS